jgi:CheY-like chemotaxis protein
VSPTAAPCVVLVVEDDVLVGAAIAEDLRSAGCEVLVSRTAEDAIAHARGNGRIDVVFTDIQLAGDLDGWDVADEFRAVNPEVPILYTSGNAADRSRRVANSLFFEKPYNLAAVVQACARHRDGHPVTQRYFLHVRDGDARLADPDGANFIDLASARAEAIESARELIAECVRTGSPMGLHRVFDIANSSGQVLATVPFSDAIARDLLVL